MPALDAPAADEADPDATMTVVDRPISLRTASLAGVAAAAGALGAGELVAGAAGAGPTLVTAVGGRFIDRFAASLKDLAVSVFGTNDKAALVTGIVVVSLLLGAALGRVARRRPVAAAAGFAAFGVVGLLSYLDDPQGRPVVGVLATLASVAVGVGVLFGLLRLAARPSAAGAAPPASLGPTDAADRRRFLVGAGATVAGAAVMAAVGRRLGDTGVVEAARGDVRLPSPGAPVATAPPAGGPGAGFDVPGLSPFITPNEDSYRIDTALSVPQVDVGNWSLRITGLVDEPFELSYDELVAMATTEATVTLQCVSNEVGGNLVGNAVWQGVPLTDLLERAGVRPEGTQVVGRSVDGFETGFLTELAGDGRTALVAVAMNGEPLPAQHGFPARLVVGGLYGYVSATKWLKEIEITTWEGFDSYWVPRGWAKEGPIKIASRVDVPRSGARLEAGTQAIAGVAWAPPVGVGRVEVQVDDGEWQDAELGPGASDETWVQWKLAWDATPGEHVIRVRATDADGVVQTEESARPAPDGASGWHRRTVKVT